MQNRNVPAKITEENAREFMVLAGITPLVSYPGYEIPWESECSKCKKIVTPTLHSIKSGQGGCAYCAGKKVDPRDVIEFMRSQGFEPLEDYPGNKLKWKCRHITCGAIVYPKYNKVQQGSNNSGCKDCSENYVDPDSAKEMMIKAGGIPQEPYPGAKRKWKCLCLNCGEIVDSLYSTVRDGGGVCQHCALKKTAAGKRNPLEKVLADYARVNLVPVENYTNTDAPLKSKCLVCGNFPSPTYTAIKSGVGCRYCSEKLIAPEHAIELARKAGLEPIEPFENAHTPWKCRHLGCGEIVSPLYFTVARGGSGCVKCNSRFAADKYRMPLEKALEIMRKAEMEPLEEYKNAVTPWKNKCNKCQKIIYPTLANVKNGSGCIRCSVLGFNLNEPAYLYLMLHPELNSLKVGVGGHSAKNDRIEAHKKYGWVLFKQQSFATGDIAYQIEQETLSWLRVDLGLPKFLVIEQMPQGGHTETIDASEIDLPTIWAKVEELSKVKR